MLIKAISSFFRSTKSNKFFNTRILLFTLILLGVAGLTAFLYSRNRRLDCSDRPLIGSYYYPWYTLQRWEWDQNTMGEPLLGPYNNSDKKIINQHIDWAQEAGIDYFIYSWLGTNKDKQTETEIAAKFIEHTNRRDIKIMPLYETPLALNQSPDRIDFKKEFLPGKKVGDQFIKDMMIYANLAQSSENFLKVNQCPRVAIYLARNMVNQEEYFSKLVKELSERNLCLDLTADVAFWNTSENPLTLSESSSEQQWKWLADNFSAVFAYNMYSDDTNGYGVTQEPSFEQLLLKAKSSNQKRWEQHAHNVGLKYHYSIQPGYDDRLLRGNDRPAAPPSEKFLLMDWERIHDDLTDSDHILITSFNEWYEGTAIEPSKKDGKSLIAANRTATNTIKRKFCN